MLTFIVKYEKIILIQNVSKDTEEKGIFFIISQIANQVGGFIIKNRSLKSEQYVLLKALNLYYLAYIY